MYKKFISVEGIQLAYTEQNSHAEYIIFFIHGNSGSSLTWDKQLESPQLSDCRLIAFDLPAHGSSMPSTDPNIDYSPIILGKIMAKAVDSLAGNRPYILIGFSFGTNVIGEMLFYKLKPAGIILASPSVISSVTDLQKVFLPNPNANSFFEDSVTPQVLEKLALDCFYLRSNQDLERFKSDFKKTNTPFRSMIMKTAGEGAVNDEIKFLNETGLFILTIFGKEDKIVNVHYFDAIPFNTWKDEIYKLPAAGHFVHVDQPEIFNQLISGYVNEMFTANRA